VYRHFDNEMQELKDDILKMGTVAQEAIAKAVVALKDLDKNAATAVLDNDDTVDEMELAIDEKAIDLIARHQPVAGDLRFLATAMKVNAEIERIADLAADIAKRVLDLADKPALKPLQDIPAMTDIARSMVRKALESFIERDEAKAKDVIEHAKDVDVLRKRINNDIINGYLAKDGATADRAVPLILAMRHIERICDHAVNVAEDVIYMVRAKVVRHHPENLG
jgi:phosphate transport system protein